MIIFGSIFLVVALHVYTTFISLFLFCYSVCSQTKVLLYSAHDSTVMALLMTLDAWKDHWPPFMSSLIFELYKRKVFYEFIV